MFGKLRLATAASQMAFDNAELALKRARSDLSTQVRNAYFGVLVAKETVRVNRAVADWTDQIYLFQEKLLEAGTAALYEAGGIAGPGLFGPAPTRRRFRPISIPGSNSLPPSACDSCL